MPFYDFIAENIDKSCEYCKNSFEVMQSIEDTPIDKCPKCGMPVRKVLSGCNFSKKKSTKEVLSDKNLSKHGFTKLVNEGGGKFRKTT